MVSSAFDFGQASTPIAHDKSFQANDIPRKHAGHLPSPTASKR